MNNINIIITGRKLGQKLEKLLARRKISNILMPKCTGYPLRDNILEFMGLVEEDKTLIAYVCNEETNKVVLSYILKYHNKKNNGIMFKILEDYMETDTKLFVGIVNAGKAEKLTDIIRKECGAGATICDAVGSGANSANFLGMRINSNKEVVLSVMPAFQVAKMKKLIKDNFDDGETDVVSFVLPVAEFNKLHTRK